MPPAESWFHMRVSSGRFHSNKTELNGDGWRCRPTDIRAFRSSSSRHKQRRVRRQSRCRPTLRPTRISTRFLGSRVSLGCLLHSSALSTDDLARMPPATTTPIVPSVTYTTENACSLSKSLNQSVFFRVNQMSRGQKHYDNARKSVRRSPRTTSPDMSPVQFPLPDIFRTFSAKKDFRSCDERIYVTLLKSHWKWWHWMGRMSPSREVRAGTPEGELRETRPGECPYPSRKTLERRLRRTRVQCHAGMNNVKSAFVAIAAGG